MRRIKAISGRRHGLVAGTAGSLALMALCAVGLVVGDPVLKVALGGFGVMLLAGDVLYLASEWIDEWRYQRLVDAYEQARRTSRPQVIRAEWDLPVWDWPVPHDMEERVDMPWGDMDDVDVTDTQTGQGVE